MNRESRMKNHESRVIRRNRPAVTTPAAMAAKVTLNKRKQGLSGAAKRKARGRKASDSDTTNVGKL